MSSVRWSFRARRRPRSCERRSPLYRRGRASRRRPRAAAGARRDRRRRFVALIKRRDYWQELAYVIAEGGFEQVCAAGLAAFRTSVVASVPELGDRVAELADWDPVKLLTVRADRLQRWFLPGRGASGTPRAPGRQSRVATSTWLSGDAVDAANLRRELLSRGDASTRQLARVQRRREVPVRLKQALQGWLQDRPPSDHRVQAGVAEGPAGRDAGHADTGTGGCAGAAHRARALAPRVRTPAAAARSGLRAAGGAYSRAISSPATP